jgi:hypothetical protein
LIEWLGEKRRDRIGRSSGSRGFSGSEQAARSDHAGEEKAKGAERHVNGRKQKGAIRLGSPP